MSTSEQWTYQECDAVLLDADEEPVVIEVGESVYVAHCDFAGNTDVTIDWSFRVTSWTCPQCGHEHNNPDDEDPYEFDPQDEDYF